MTLLGLIISLVIVGLVLWLLTLIPIDPKIRTIINAVVIIAVVVWLLVNLLPAGGILNARIGK